MGSLEEDYACFRALVGPLPRMATPHTWAGYEAALGLEFPPDYRMWVEEYPALFFLRFLHVDSLLAPPVPVEEVIDIFDGSRELLDEFGCEIVDDTRRIIEVVPTPPFYPAPGGLLYLAQSDNGDYCAYRTAPDPRDWTVVVLDGVALWDSGRGFAAFLTGLLTGEHPCPLFPDDLERTPSVQASYSVRDAEGNWQVFHGDRVAWNQPPSPPVPKT